jgi:hypothetical protein
VVKSALPWLIGAGAGLGTVAGLPGQVFAETALGDGGIRPDEDMRMQQPEAPLSADALRQQYNQPTDNLFYPGGEPTADMTQEQLKAWRDAYWKWQDLRPFTKRLQSGDVQSPWQTAE